MCTQLSPKSLERFTIFQALPIELRLNIWEQASLVPRAIPIRVETYSQLLPEAIKFEPFRYTTYIANPSVLHACSESREVALKIFTLSFGTKNTLKCGLQVSTTSHIYVNLDQDIICPLNLRNWGLDIRAHWLHEVGMKRVAINVSEEDLKAEADGRGGDLPFLLGMPPSVTGLILYSLPPRDSRCKAISTDNQDVVPITAGDIDFIDFAKTIQDATEEKTCKWTSDKVKGAGDALIGAWEKFELDSTEWVDMMWEDQKVTGEGVVGVMERKEFEKISPRPAISLNIITVDGALLL